MKKIFACNVTASPEARRSWSDLVRREFYDGDIELVSRQPTEVVFEKSSCHSVALTHLTSTGPLVYRRTSNHIRNNKVGLKVVWFVKSGSIKIVRSNGVSTLSSGEMGIMDSNVPFTASASPDEDGVLDSFQLIIPPDVFFAHLEEAEKFTAAVPVATSESAIVQDLLDLLVDNSDQLSDDIVRPLLESFLEAIANSLRSSATGVARRQGLVDRRLEDIEDFIMMNLTDPCLSYDKVATSCGISPRYLCYVLKANNTSFSDLLWKNRLTKAHDCLISPATINFPVHEIAYMCGYKSAAHFSRMFKNKYGSPPREYRTIHLQRKASSTDSGQISTSGQALVAA